MTTKTKVLGAIAAAAAATIVGAYAYAQGGPGMGHSRMGGMGHGMMGNTSDPTARLEAIKTAIGIRPEQAGAWDTYAKVVAEVSDERRSVRSSIDRDAVHKLEPKDRQAFREGMQGQRDASTAKVRAAAETLLAELDDAQKDKARRELPGLAASGHGEGKRQGMRGGHGQGHGMGRGTGQHNNR